jgi:hypothetical protein
MHCLDLAVGRHRRYAPNNAKNGTSEGRGLLRANRVGGRQIRNTKLQNISTFICAICGFPREGGREIRYSKSEIRIQHGYTCALEALCSELSACRN